MGSDSPRSVRCRSTDGRWAFDIPEAGSVTVGRDPRWAQVVIPYAALSREHVRFRNQGGACVVEYAGARGGILINGEFLREPSRRLRPGDRVALLGDVLTFVVQPGDAASKSKAAEPSAAADRGRMTPSRGIESPAAPAAELGVRRGRPEPRRA